LAKVSIILPTLNRLELLKKSIDSVLAQTYTDWELHVIDDVSDDGTKEYMNSLTDKRINYHRVNIPGIEGISKYLNFGIENSTGEYIARLDDDDFWCDENKLQKQVNFLDSHPDYFAAGGGIIMIDEKGNELFRYQKRESDEEIRKYALFANPFSHTTVMFRKDAALKAGLYTMPYIEDWNLWLKMGESGKYYNFQEYFTMYLSAGQNNSLKIQRKLSRQILKLISEFKYKYPHYRRAYFLNCIQYVYSFLPLYLRTPLQSRLYYIKRKFF
jgi:glycosyltransferase involved in cell wall biosynthesis